MPMVPRFVTPSRPTIPPGWILAFILLWLGGTQMLLWRFLNVAPWWWYVLGAGLLAGLCIAMVRGMAPIERTGPSLGMFACCLLLALVLLLLAGEGRFAYSNPDWQVRDAVLRDMAVNPWPFVYTARSLPDVLRAPIGLFFVPALAYKQFGAAGGDIALLVQNSLLLSCLFALGGILFPSGRARLIAAIICVSFSGLDVIGYYLVHHRISGHLDGWLGLEYSSTITLLFWVPQHAFAGWIGTVGFLWWRAGRMPLGPFLALIPLTALWSPLGMIGTLPFALLAGVRTLLARRLTIRDILLPAAAMLLSLPSLFYLAAAGDAVGARLFPIDLLAFGMFQMLETLPYLIPIGLAFRSHGFDRGTFVVTALCLLLMPLVQVGWSTDFMMRAAIPALAVMAMMVVERLTQPDTADTRRVRIWLVAMIAIGSLTGIAEIRRAFVLPPSPRGNCSFFKAWDQNFASYPKGSYLAPLAKMPALVRPVAPARASAREPTRCWSGQWPLPSQAP